MEKELKDVVKDIRKHKSAYPDFCDEMTPFHLQLKGRKIVLADTSMVLKHADDLAKPLAFTPVWETIEIDKFYQGEKWSGMFVSRNAAARQIVAQTLEHHSDEPVYLELYFDYNLD